MGENHGKRDDRGSRWTIDTHMTRLQSGGVNLPSEAGGQFALRGCRLGSLGRATIVSATRRSWEFDDVHGDPNVVSRLSTGSVDSWDLWCG